MSVSFNVIERGEPGVAGGGQKKYYASLVSKGEVGVDDLTSYIEDASTVNGADIRAVIYALITNVSKELAKGNIVKLGDLGTFRLSISSEGHEEEDKVSANSVKSAKILFRPGSKLNTMLKTLDYKKA